MVYIILCQGRRSLESDTSFYLCTLWVSSTLLSSVNYPTWRTVHDKIRTNTYNWESVVLLYNENTGKTPTPLCVSPSFGCVDLRYVTLVTTPHTFVEDKTDPWNKESRPSPLPSKLSGQTLVTTGRVWGNWPRKSTTCTNGREGG